MRPMPPSDDSERNRCSARAARYARVGTRVGGVAARIAGQRLVGAQGGREGNAIALASALGGLKGPIMKVAQLLATIPDAVPPEYASELMKLQSQAPPRPMTHDLLSDMLEQLGAQVIRITVTELRENTFYAQITVVQDGNEIEVDSRPSDAIALAIRAEAPIFAADRVIEESAIEFEGDEVTEEQLEEEVTKFKHFLEEVTPDQFAVEEGEEDDGEEDEVEE